MKTTTKEQLKSGRYTLDYLSTIEGAFDKGNTYMCVSDESDAVYTKGVVYPCNGHGIVDNFDKGRLSSCCKIGDSAHFQLVGNGYSQEDFEKGVEPPIGTELYSGSVISCNGVEKWRETPTWRVVATHHKKPIAFIEHIKSGHIESMDYPSKQHRVTLNEFDYLVNNAAYKFSVGICLTDVEGIWDAQNNRFVSVTAMYPINKCHSITRMVSGE